MSYQRPKWKSYTLPSVEPAPHILRAPPSSIHTRKKERVSDVDTNYMISEDPSRINEGISYLARGTNVMQDVSYNNYGNSSRTNSMSNIQASNPYKIQNVRPPMYSVEDLEPLSRSRHGRYAVQTAPTVSGYGLGLEDSSDKKGTAFSLKKSLLFAARPTAVYRMDLPVEVFDRNAVTDDRIKVAGKSGFTVPYTYDMPTDHSNPIEASRQELKIRPGTNPNNPLAIESRNEEINLDAYIKKILVGKIDPNFSIVIHNANTKDYSEVAGSIKDKLNLAVQTSIGAPISLSSTNGENIKLKDYRWKIVQSAMGSTSLVLNVVNDPELKLDRNTPLYSMGSSVSGVNDYGNARMNENEINLRSKIMTSAGPSVSKPYGNGRDESVFDSDRNILLRRQGNYGHFSNFGTIPQLQNHHLPDLSVERSEMENSVRSQLGNRFSQH